MPFEQQETKEIETRRRSYATQPASKFKWCSARCNVWRHKGCCYNPVCRKRSNSHKRACRWFNYLTGIFNMVIFLKITSQLLSLLFNNFELKQKLFRKNLSTPRQLAPWQLDLRDAGDSNPRNLLLGQRRTIVSRFLTFN